MSMLIGCIFGMQEKYADLLKAETTGLKEHWTRIQIPSCSSRKLQEEMEELQSKFDCYFVREDIMEESGKTVTVRSVSDLNVFSRIPLKNGTIPQNNEQYIATYQTEDPYQTGVMADLFEDDPRRFQSLFQYWHTYPENGEGLYFLCCPAENENEVLTQLAAALDTTVEQLRNINSFKQYDEGPVKIMIAGMVVLGLLFVLMCLFYPVSQIKRIGIYKLLGFSEIKIWFYLLSPVFIAGSIVVVFNVFAQFIFVSGITIPYIVRACLLQVGLLTGCIFLSTISMRIIHQYTLHSILNGNHHGMLIYWISVILKLATFILFIALIPSLITLFQTLSYQVQAASAFEKSATEMTIEEYDFVKDEFQQKLNGNDVVAKKMKIFFEEVEKTANARYMNPVLYDQSYFRGVHKSVPSDFEPIVVMNVNENELNLYSSWFDQPVGTYFQNEGIAILIPDTMNDTVRDLIIDAIKYPWEVQNREIKTEIYTYHAKNSPVFTQNMLLINQGYPFVEDPVFVCLNNSVPEAWIGLDSQSLSNPIRINETEKNIKAIRTALDQAGLSENNVKFASIYDAVFKTTIDGMKRSSLLMASAVGFLFLVDLFASYYLTLIVLSIRKKEIFVKKILGYSFWLRYSNEWMNEAVNGLLGVCALILMRQSLFGFLIYSILLLLDWIVMSIMMRKQENKTLSLMLKGGYVKL